MNGQCNNWQPLGPNDSNEASISGTTFASITMDTSGNPYIVYQDGAYNNKATVKCFKNNKWETIGLPGFSYGTVQYTSIAISKQDTVFVAYIDNSISNSEVVMKFNGVNWVPAGATQQMSPGSARYSSIAIDSAGTPYVGFEDSKDGSKATVMKYTDTGWVVLGSEGFSDGIADQPALTLDAHGNPYIIYVDNANSNGATVMKYNGSSWVPVGIKNITSDVTTTPAIAIGPDDTVFIAISNGTNSYVDVMKFNGTSWVPAGRSNLTLGATGGLSLTVDNKNTPYVLFQDYYAGQKATVMKLIDTTWTVVGSRGFMSSQEFSNKIITSPDGTPYTVFDPGEAIAMKLIDTTWTRLGDIGTYFNSGNLTVVVDTASTMYMGGTAFDAKVGLGVVKYVDTGWVEIGHPLVDGLFPSFALSQSGTPYILCADQSSLKAIVMKYIDTSWVYVGTPKFSPGEIYYPTIAVDHHGTPYIAFADNTNNNEVMVMKYVDTSWVVVGSPDFTSPYPTYAMTLALDTGGVPYVAYQFQGSYDGIGVMKFNGTSWVNVNAPITSYGIPDYVSLVFDNNNVPYLAIESHQYKQAYVMKYTSGSWKQIGLNASPKATGYCSLAVDSAGTPFLAYEDGAASDAATVVKYNGSAWVPVNKPGLSEWQSTYTSLAVDPYGSLYLGYLSRFAFAKKYGCEAAADTFSLNGAVYLDKNTNCKYDSGDIPIKGIKVIAIHNSKIVASVITDSTGKYNFSTMAKGYHYLIEIDSSSLNGYFITCPLSGKNFTVAPSSGNNFALQCGGKYSQSPKICSGQSIAVGKNIYDSTGIYSDTLHTTGGCDSIIVTTLTVYPSNGFDLAGNLYVCIDTPSFSNASIQACIFNNRCRGTDGTLKLVLDTAFHITSTTADSIAHVSGDTLTWNYDSLSDIGKTHCVSLNGHISNIPAGDSVAVSMFITPVPGDSVPANNSVTYWVKPTDYKCQGLPFDPNEKSVYPQGDITTNTLLNYTIHFQNTGSAPAHNVVVVDTLSPFVDPTTLTVTSGSAEVITTINGGNIVTFTFNGINLPDTATSKTLSIGIVKYTILPLSSDIAGTQIKNHAGIYFDANPEIITNTTVNTIPGAPLFVQNISTALNIAAFPNPFTTTTSIVFNTDGLHSLEVDDVTGRKLESIQCTGKQYELSRKNLADGVYFIKAFDAEHKYVAVLKFIVQ
jgi:uncharacterized repeat protein (TIGR01451 family)